MEQAKTVIVALTKEELDDMMAKAALVGATAAAETLDKAREKEKKEWADRRLHNTKLLLKNYQMLKENCEKAIYKREHGISAADEMEEIMTMRDDKTVVESIRRTSERTAVILAHIDKMLEVYRIYTSKCSEREKRQYKVIRDLYISKEKLNVKEISKKYGVSKVTVYDDIKIAEERLSALFFGIDGVKFY